MDTLETKLEELEELLKATILPTITPNNGAGRPRGPGITPAPIKVPKTSTGISHSSKKDPVKVAAQLKDPDLKMRAREQIAVDQGGQWAINKTDAASGTAPQSSGFMSARGQSIAGGISNRMDAAGGQSSASPTSPQAATPSATTNNSPFADKTSYLAQGRDGSFHGSLLDQSGTTRGTGQANSAAGATLTERQHTYGPYSVSTTLQPRVNAGGQNTDTSANLSHTVRFTGQQHDPAQMAKLGKELSLSGAALKEVGKLSQNDSWSSSAFRSAQTNTPGKTPNLWNANAGSTTPDLMNVAKNPAMQLGKTDEYLSLSQNGQWTLQKARNIGSLVQHIEPEHKQAMRDALQFHESAPSAHCLVLSHLLGRPLTDKEVHGLYNRGMSIYMGDLSPSSGAPPPAIKDMALNPAFNAEIWHDNQVKKHIDAMNPKQFHALRADMLDILNERKEADYDDDSGKEALHRHIKALKGMVPDNLQ